MKKKFITLWILGVISTAAAIPYLFELQRDILSPAPLPIFTIGLLMVAQTAVFLAIAVYFGLKLAESLNLRVLGVFGQENNARKASIKSVLKIAIPAGIIAAVLIWLADLLFIKFTPSLSEIASARPAVWKAILASMYGGVVEELLLRLFFVSLIVWIIAKITKAAEPAKNNIIMWAAIIVAAVLFGLGHLPVTAALTAITPMIVLRAVLLNGIGGLIFGWLYWKRGLEAAIISHFTADIFLLVIINSVLQ